jgi:hypothetical protein
VCRVRKKIELTELHSSVTALRFQYAAIANRAKLFGMIVMFGFTTYMSCAVAIESTLSG